MLPCDLEYVLRPLTRRSRAHPALESARTLLAKGDVMGLTALTQEPASFSSALEYLEFSALRDLIRKCDGLLPKAQLEAKAVEAFFESERQCFSTNYRLNRLEDNSGIWRFIDHARCVVASVLGALPKKLDGRHGPGSTYGTPSARSTIADKFTSAPTLTPGAARYLAEWSQTAWARTNRLRRQTVDCVPGNRFTSVPKDSLKNRGICIEPSLNVFYQLAFGSAIRRRLGRVGIDLDRGQDIHRDRAREASITGAFATIDLSNASDTVCYELVRMLLPPEWFIHLDSLRSPKTFIKGRWVYLEKFSSMGNGFTFELESLIFYSLVRTALELNSIPADDILVYGDDIIVPSQGYDEVVAALSFFGFSTNSKKSFSRGPFRESCGGDFFSGVDVRPHFLKEIPNEPSQWIAFANGLRRLLTKFPSDHPFYRDALLAWHRCLQRLPSNVRRLRGPAALGDIVIHDDLERWVTKEAWSIRYVKTWQPVPRHTSWAHFHPEVVYTCGLYGLLIDPRGITSRGAISGFKEKWVPYS